MSAVTSASRRPAEPGPATRRRIRAARLADARLWLGIGLVVAAMVAGALLVNAGGDDVLVLRASRDLSAGAVPVDLVPVAVSRGLAAEAYVSGDVPAGSVLRWPVPAGALLPRSALVQRDLAPRREVTVPVDPMHAPAELLTGDRVDVWVSPRQDTSDGPAPRLVLANVAIVSAQADRVGLGGEMAVVVEVADTDVAGIVAASRTGVLDLVRVPVAAQPALPERAPGQLDAIGS